VWIQQQKNLAAQEQRLSEIEDVKALDKWEQTHLPKRTAEPQSKQTQRGKANTLKKVVRRKKVTVMSGT
jgi:hypothetical protein